MKSLFAVIVLCTILLGCNQPAPQSVNKVTPTAYSVGGGNKVIFLSDYYVEYLKALKANGKNNDSLYRNIIRYPIMNNYFSSCEFSQFVEYEFSYPMQDTNGLRGRFNVINNNRERINKIITSTLEDCNKYLKNDSITVYIQPFEGGYMESIIRRMRGVAGFTAGSKQILIQIDPEVSTWSDVLADGLAHEYNHAYWTKMNFKNPSNKWDMLSYLIFEGRADSYAHLIYPNIIAPWDTALSDKEKADLWAKIKPQLHGGDMSFQREVMFGGKDDYPIWGGYCLGYTIVQSALKNNPNLKPEEWTILSPEKILEMSDYK